MSGWKVSLACTAAEGRALADDPLVFASLDPPPALVAAEAAPGRWRIDAYFDARPDRASLAELALLVPSHRGAPPKPARLPDSDWAAISQQGLEPVRAGRFLVRTPRARGRIPSGMIALEIDAGLAFGTGHHETTRGCLEAIDRLKRNGRRFRNVADIGTGTGLLAFAAMKLWPTARAIASDIDPTAIRFAREAAGANAIRLGEGPGHLALVIAAGLDHPRLRARAPFDLILANILAGPLITLAPAFAFALAPGGRIILAGLLERQRGAVESAWRRQGLRRDFVIRHGEWPCLVLRRPLPSLRNL